MAVAGSSSVSKFSLGHILDGDDDEGSSLRVNSNSSRHETASGRPSAGRGGRRRAMTAEEKRVARTCIVDGCANYIVHRKRCFRHGGGKTCSVEGCNTSAKQRGLCWRHGGSILCSIDGCTRGVKSRGLCWTHGGGNKKVKTEHSPESDDGSSTASEAPEPQSKRGAAAAAGSAS
uniref:WRKY19-like zinc finger domain-containing protein n=1 Tax=Globisporangium ultimum (strain ATCC 200006 / CBS 805.95 / DAOM BR144) TaxID=431595 RepID=K3WWI1_GLOUD